MGHGPAAAAGAGPAARPGLRPRGHREYAEDAEDAVDRVRIFQQFYAAGLPSRRIAELLPCIDTDTTTDHQWAMLNAEHARTSTQIDQLTTALARLTERIEAAADRQA